jgi:hypothetical protein
VAHRSPLTSTDETIEQAGARQTFDCQRLLLQNNDDDLKMEMFDLLD